jgi:hypothetical protein
LLDRSIERARRRARPGAVTEAALPPAAADSGRAPPGAVTAPRCCQGRAPPGVPPLHPDADPGRAPPSPAPGAEADSGRAALDRCRTDADPGAVRMPTPHSKPIPALPSATALKQRRRRFRPRAARRSRRADAETAQCRQAL